MAKRIVCTVCPMSCEVELTVNDQNEVTKVAHNRCPRGKDYAIKEYFAPERTLTTTVRVRGGAHPLIPVRTDRPIPKELLFEAMKVTASVEVEAPVKMGDVVVHDLLGTGANLIASRNMH